MDHRLRRAGAARCAGRPSSPGIGRSAPNGAEGDQLDVRASPGELGFENAAQRHLTEVTGIECPEEPDHRPRSGTVHVMPPCCRRIGGDRHVSAVAQGTRSAAGENDDTAHHKTSRKQRSAGMFGNFFTKRVAISAAAFAVVAVGGIATVSILPALAAGVSGAQRLDARGHPGPGQPPRPAMPAPKRSWPGTSRWRSSASWSRRPASAAPWSSRICSTARRSRRSTVPRRRRSRAR